MRDSLQTLLADSLDYAGLFPPANLPFDAALRDYLAYRDHPSAWLLARFVCSADRLEQLGEHLDAAAKQGNSAAVRLSVLGRRPAGDGATAISDLHADGALVQSFVASREYSVSIEFYETSLPHVWIGDSTAIADLAEQAHEAFLTRRLTPQCVFLEIPWRLEANAITEIARAVAGRASGGTTCGLKIRTGGLEASAFPPASNLARFIVACSAAGCRWKATAGLHSPLSAYDKALGVWHCGFLNLFAAAVMSHAHALPAEEVETLLQEPTIDAFQFRKASFTWRGYAVTNEQITAARRESLVSFGSCSFDEPVDGLARLHLREEMRHA